MPINLHNITMDYKMELFTLFLCVLPAFVISITITPNGNSPEIKMVGGMTMDVQSDFVPMESKVEETTVRASRGKRRRSNNNNSTKLSINERYRRLIPYMTFYYANDLAIPTTDNIKEVEVEKAEIVETDLDHANNREPKKIIYSNRNIPRYQGNRLTQHNIASANPTKVYYKGGVPIYQTQGKVSQNYNPLLSEYSVPVHNDYENGRVVHKQVPKSPGITFVSATRKPYLNLYNEDSPNVRYYTSEKPKYKLVPYEQYKLVPYEQTPPVKVSQNENVYDITKKPIPVPVSVILPKEQVYLKPRPARPHYVNVEVQQANIRKQPTIVSESYYEKQRPQLSLAQPVIQSGFRPIFKVPQYSDDASIYTTSLPEREHSDFEHQKEQSHLQSEPMNYEEFKPHYYQHVVDQTPYKLPPQTKTNSRPIPLASLLNTLQLNKSIPKPITKENVGSSIRTLLQVLNVLKSVEPESQVINPIVLSTPKPFVAEKVLTKPAVVAQPDPNRQAHVVPDDELTAEPYLAPINPPSQYLDDITPGGGTSQHFPLVQASDDEGGTPGRPGVDYPILTTIPPTSFDCKTQRYKGFFADTETRCQVWHYCDLNGGQASFLCPNGTIFSQAGLTCDWWFNVQCASTTQLYVLNESLYKYILPHSPKFPEDYSGPLVDKYLTLKFKEMEEEFKKNKNKQSASEKADSDEEESDDSEESSTEKEDSSEQKDTDTSKEKEAESAVNAASVLVGSPGESGKVERLQDD